MSQERLVHLSEPDAYILARQERLRAFEDAHGRPPHNSVERLRIHFEAQRGEALPEGWEEQFREAAIATQARENEEQFREFIDGVIDEAAEDL